MEFVALDEKVQQALDSFDWNKIQTRNEPNTTAEMSDGLLMQVGCDYQSLLMDFFSTETAKEHTGTSKIYPTPPRPEGCLPQPRHSSLTFDQQIFYLKNRDQLRDFATLHSSSSAKQKKSLSAVTALYHKLHPEQREYEEYARRIADQRIDLYNFVLPIAQQVFKLFISQRLNRLQQIEQAYVYQQSFPISVVPYTNDPQPKYEDFCAKLGSPRFITIPEAEDEIPAYQAKAITSDSLKSVAEDENVEKLVKSLNADIVISMSALRTLANNTKPFDNEWEMPMTKKEFQDSSGKSKTVLFIDKPLPPKSVNGREKMYRYFKKALKHFVLNYSVSTTEKGSERTDRGRDEMESSQEDPSLTNEDSSSDSDDSSIPQLDGANDKVTEKKAKASDRKTRVSSIPESLSRAASLSVWTTSLQRSPKRAVRSKSAASSESGFGKWSSMKVDVPQKKPEISAVSTESEDELIIDTESEGDEKKMESKELSKRSEEEEEPKDVEEQQEISFKATAIPGSILDSVLDPEEFSDFSAAEDTSEQRAHSLSPQRDISPVPTSRHCPSPPTTKEPSPMATRRSSRQQSKSKAANSESKTDLEMTSPTRRSLRQRIRSSSKSEDLEKTSAKAQNNPTKSTRKRSRKSDNSSSDNVQAKQSKSDVTDKKKVNSKKFSSTSKKQEQKKSSVKKSRIRRFSSSSDDIPLSDISKTVSNVKTVSPIPSSVLLVSEVTIKTPKTAKKKSTTTLPPTADKSAEIQKQASVTTETQNQTSHDISAGSDKSSFKVTEAQRPTSSKITLTQTQTAVRPTESTPKLTSKKTTELQKQTAPQITGGQKQIVSKATETKATIQEKSDCGSGDVLGQILSMQKTRRETTQVKASLKSTAKPLTFKTIVPTVPQPAGDFDFDSTLVLHHMNLTEFDKSVFYSLWSIGSFRVLIRGCLHGKLRPKEGSTEGPEFATIHTKLEYQHDLGYERLTKSEACSEWLDLQFRPQPSTVLRCRVDPVTNKVLRCDRVRNEASTYMDFKDAEFNHLQANKLLLSVFQKLKACSNAHDKGSYLICHKHNESDFIIRAGYRPSTARMVIYDLQREYANPGRMVLCTPQTIPWIPPDPWKQTKWQHENRRIPMTFDPSPNIVEVKKKKGKKKKKQKEAVQ